MSIGILCWSVALIGRRGLAPRAAGLVGVSCAAIPVAVLWMSGVYLQPANLAGFILGQGIWGCVVAGLMLSRGRWAGGSKPADPARVAAPVDPPGPAP